MATSSPVTAISIPSLTTLSQGKVRTLFAIPPSSLLLVTSDRISAYDVILANGIPLKGPLLTLLSAHWLRLLSRSIPTLRHHLISLTPPRDLPLSAAERKLLHGRCMHVQRLRVIPIEAIVRGYVTGSAWTEYQKSGTVHGILQPAGLQNGSPFPNGPIYTPSTKAELGAHDENISAERAADIIGDADLARKVEALALQLYRTGAAYALERGIIVADTKFEFGVDEDGEVVLVDEVLTPDSSRFWSKDAYEVGREQESFDKQYLRDWLTAQGLKGKEGTIMPDEVVEKTAARYRDAFEKLTGQKIEEAMAGIEV